MCIIIKVPFIILRHCCMHCPCWLCKWGGALWSKFIDKKHSLANQHSVHLLLAFTLVKPALCVKSQRTLKGTLVFPSFLFSFANYSYISMPVSSFLFLSHFSKHTSTHLFSQFCFPERFSSLNQVSSFKPCTDKRKKHKHVKHAKVWNCKGM